MSQWAKVNCLLCDQRVPLNGVFRGDGGRVAICATCYGLWEHGGRPCIACALTVDGRQDVAAFFKPRPSLGHADCGGILVSR